MINIDDRGTQTLLKAIDRKVLVLALKAGNEKVKTRFFNNISQRAADMILDDIEALGLVPLNDVKVAQAMIVEIALQLENDGKIIITKLDNDQLV